MKPLPTLFFCLTLTVAAAEPVKNEKAGSASKKSTAGNVLRSVRSLDDGSVGNVYELKLPGGVTMKFCYCPPGKFQMGSSEGENGRLADEDQVGVEISKGFWIAQTECTQAQWLAVMEINPSRIIAPTRPVENMTWGECQDFPIKCNLLKTVPRGWQMALPTEAQWEYACRAGTTSLYSFGNDASQLHRYGNFADKTSSMLSGDRNQDDGMGDCSAKVARYVANPWGLYDMHGNVSEWCMDWYGESLPKGKDPKGAISGVVRVHRGGSWRHDASGCRSASRHNSPSGERLHSLGFRPVLVQ